MSLIGPLTMEINNWTDINGNAESMERHAHTDSQTDRHTTHTHTHTHTHTYTERLNLILFPYRI